MTSISDLRKRRQLYLDIAEAKRATVADLRAEYGNGIRPSWVSAEIAIETDAAIRYTEEAQKLTAEIISRQ